MNATGKSLDVTIMGRTYKVTCADDERAALLEAVAYLDQKMNEVKASGRVGNIERIAVTAALNIAHELLEARAQHEDRTTQAPAGDGFDLAEVKRRMQLMRATLDQALAPQEKLL